MEGSIIELKEQLEKELKKKLGGIFNDLDIEMNCITDGSFEFTASLEKVNLILFSCEMFLARTEVKLNINYPSSEMTFSTSLSNKLEKSNLFSLNEIFLINEMMFMHDKIAKAARDMIYEKAYIEFLRKFDKQELPF